MRRFLILPAVVLFAGLLCTSRPADAQSAGPAPGVPPAVQVPAADAQSIKNEIAQLRHEFDELRKAYSERLAALEARIAAVTAASSSAAQPAQAPAPAPEAPAGSSKVFNPDIAVIGNVMGTAGRNPVAPSPSFELREAEFSFQAVVDPYARGDFFVSVGSEGANLEEGYVTFPTVPGGLLVKAGRMRTAFGKTNGLHPHVLPWPDRPLVMRNLVGGDEGMADAGVSVARLIPNPWVFLEATGQALSGNAGNVFTADRASDVSYLGHLRAYQDVNESTNIDLGASFTAGHNDAGWMDGGDAGRFTTRLYSVDATVRYKPLRRSIYRSFVGRTELVWSRRQQFDGLQPAFGYYVSGDYQFARRWFAGLRYDRSNRADDATVLDSGMAAVLTFWPSEFSQLRSMYRRTRYARTDVANELLFQLQFAIGAHGAHPF